MKTKSLNFWASVVVLMGTVTSATSFAQPVDPQQLQSMIDAQCMREIRESKVWRNALAFHDLPEQARMKKEACDCVYQDVIQDSSIKALLNAGSSSPQQPAELVSKAVLKSLRGCTQKILN
ncbi:MULTISPECIES: hypothetical protein [unclassified Acinetobacter]|uniref:hypothetical protein n=1 Tax=unclassified Acinetobacter TaxID=196816 RepID=UPI00293413DF|nr:MULTISPECIES: hypothetical protein [unclassified Acinetobacter]WOE32596.1 hypothetical protein QSG84_05245 [Acinetobacter sp. SAAs470]WOE38071.1 hypothetical protein QSG86_14300 [Acinetobacter sp. SAAs474]